MTAAPRTPATPRTRPAGPRLRHAPLRPFRTPVRGHAFAARPRDAAAPDPGVPARLAREPDNPADPLAVAVWLTDPGPPWRIGYLDRGVAARLAPRLDDGQGFTARLEGWLPEPDGRWQRPLLVVEPARAPGSVPSRPGGVWGRPPGVVRRRVR